MMNHKNERENEIKEIFKRYLNHQASATEMEAVDHWYDTLELSDDKIKVQSQRRLKINAVSMWASAACICLISVFAVWFYFGSGKMLSSDIQIKTAATERKEVTLADGTVVILNTGTTLLVSNNFGKQERRVVLKGEAYFKVAKNPEKPFVIQSGQLRTKVLGTSFNISAYPDRERIKVSVLTGLVTVSQNQGKLEKTLAARMRANQTISYFKNTGKYELNNEDALLITSWRDNKLYIDNASINDIAAQLKDFYHLDVNNRSHAGQEDRYTIRFDKESISSVLQILTQLTQREFEYHNKKITIK